MTLSISPAGRAAIQRFEGLRLMAYRDSGGVWTIGYGHTPAQEGQTLTLAAAEELLDADIATALAGVERLVKVPLTQGQTDALASFVFNLGAERLRTSTLLRKLNAGDYPGAAAEFSRWVHAGGQVLPGLVARRQAEAALFGASNPDTQPPAPVEERPATTQDRMENPMDPLIIPAAISLAEKIPDLIRVFGGSDAKKVEARADKAQAVVDLVTKATGAVNAQDAIQKIADDPQAKEAAHAAIRDNWFALVPSDGGVSSAREFADRHENSRYGKVLENVTYAAIGMLVFANIMVGTGMLLAICLKVDALYTAMLTSWNDLKQADIVSASTAFGFWLGSHIDTGQKKDAAPA